MADHIIDGGPGWRVEDHTTGLLHVEERGISITLRTESGTPIAEMWMTGREEFDAARLCAAWNACIDAPTDILAITGAKVVPPALTYVQIEAQRDALADALRLILPMAKAHAAAHPVGSNAEIVAQAEAVLHL